MNRCLSFVRILAICVAGCGASFGHPGALGEYPERIPGKTLQQIKAEWEPPPPDAVALPDLLDRGTAIVGEWTTIAPQELLARVEKLGSDNRQGDYRKRIANLVNDMLDLLQSGEAGRTLEAKDYLRWRLDHLEEDDGFFEQRPEGHWDEKPERRTERNLAWENERNHGARAISARADTASATLRPHWLIQAGALEFKHPRFSEAGGYFARVIEAFPKHPRAEVGWFMQARVALEAWTLEKRGTQRESGRLSRLQHEMWAAVKSYREQFPEGRFALDLNGWEAGYYLENGSLSEAMAGFLRQAAGEFHPEVRRRAFQQIEWMLRQLVSAPGELESMPWGDIAKEPLVALRMGYFMLDARSSTDLGAIMFRRGGEDHRALETLEPELAAVRSAARKAWPLLDSALARQEAQYAGDRAVIRTVLHGWSAIIRGLPGVVLGEISGSENGQGSKGRDDLALVRIFALLKAGKSAEAVADIEAFRSRHGGSPLNRGMLLRSADSCIELGQTSAAIPLLWEMLEGNDVAITKADVQENPPLNLPGEAMQRFSALLTYAPLDQLVRAAESAKDKPRLRSALNGALRIRYLCQWQFDDCLRFATAADFEGWQPAYSNGNDDPAISAGEWRAKVGSLQQQTLAAGAATDPSEKARAWIALGNTWRANFRRLVSGGAVYLPDPYFHAQVSQPSFQLRKHAQILHIEDSVAATALDQRNELTHALRCYEKAIKIAPGVSSQAYDLLNDTLFLRAETSPYFMDRAVEMKDRIRSQELAVRMKAGFPKTEMALSAVPWTFQPSAALGEWQPGGIALWQVEVMLASRLGKPANETPEDDWRESEALRNLTERLRRAIASNGTFPEMLDELSLIRAAVKRDVPSSKSASLLNHLDDLSLVLRQSGVSPSCFTSYATARFRGAPMNANDPDLAAAQDFVGFWNAVVTPSGASPDGPGRRQRIAQVQIERMNQFLRDFPGSAKREAAMARLAINTLRQSRCHCGLEFGDMFRNGTSEYARFAVESGVPFNRESESKMLESYEREFPIGRYSDELKLIRGLAAAEAEDWREAMVHLVATLDNADKPDLHLDASNTMCSIFMKLLEPARRLAIRAAIESVPGTKAKLLIFMHTPSCGWRLRMMEDWIRSSPAK